MSTAAPRQGRRWHWRTSLLRRAESVLLVLMLLFVFLGGLIAAVFSGRELNVNSASFVQDYFRR